MGENPKSRRLSACAAERRVSVSEQKFWKFHILRESHGYRLTTNPTEKHSCCRSAPDYHVVHSGTVLRLNDAAGELIAEISKAGADLEYKVLRPRRLSHGQIKLVDGDYILQGVLHAGPKGFTLPTAKGSWVVGPIPTVEYNWWGTDTVETGKDIVYFHKDSASPQIKAMLRPCDAGLRKRVSLWWSRVLVFDTDASDAAQPYKCGDGLHRKDPRDDEPGRDKLGWLTVYDDALFGNEGMYDLAVAACLAAHLV